ncbi:MAG TPA: DUF3299 domain-containing protein [Gemmatimonadaceae bacterium]|jgi:hypothetical protein|nr:DUF3299 domain-containing protein [Gemmatimonadaceae bacterium]
MSHRTNRPRRVIAAAASALGALSLLGGAAPAGYALPEMLPAGPLPWSAEAAPVPSLAVPSADAIALDWKMLGTLDYQTGKVPEALKKLEGQLVKIPGFIVPLEDYEEEGAEFLLVPYFGACVHTPPPPPNQMVYVRMEGGKRLKFGWWDPVWMEGKLKIEHYDSPYGAVGFQLTGTRTTPYGAEK